MEFLNMEKNFSGRQEELEEIVESSQTLLFELNGGTDKSKMEDFVGAFENKTPTLMSPQGAFYRILEEVKKNPSVNPFSIDDPVTGYSIEDCWNHQSFNRLALGILIGTVVKPHDEEIKRASRSLSKLIVEQEVITHSLQGVDLNVDSSHQ